MRVLEFVPNSADARVRPKGWVLRIGLACGLAAFLSAPLAQTAESEPMASPQLGVPEVLSPMGSPLWIRIPVDVKEAAISAAGANFSLGPRPANAGIPFIENAEISFERQGDKNYLMIRSRQPVNELAVGLVIREQLIRGVRSREFTVLLDPPVLFDAILAARASEASQNARSATVKLLSQAAAIETFPVVTTGTAAVAASRPVRPVRSNLPRRPVAAVTAVAPSNVVVANAKRSVKPAQSERTQAIAEAKAAARKASPDKPLRLSLSAADFAVPPTANEATRTELRRRQLILDTDNLMSALLERNHKITLLEKELAGLAARVMATERSLNIPAPPTATAASTTTTATPNLAAQSTAAATTILAAPGPELEATVAPSKPPAIIAPPPQTESTRRPVRWWSIALMIAGLVAVAIATLAIMRRRRVARDDMKAVSLGAADASASPPRQAAVPASADFAEEPITDMPPPPSPPPVAEIPAAVFPEIQFELPKDLSAPNASVEAAASRNLHATVDGSADAALPPSSHAANSDALPAPDDIRGRRTRYLQSRYQDIAILMPPLDAPQRLIKQAGRIHDEGAVDYAKRLLKYAAYSRPYAEEFWLALLELLYREKFANDYLVNAKWFREYLPDSANWDEVQRIGYLLDPAAPLFASAAAWSHEEPILATWLPANQAGSAHARTRPELKLELAS